MTSEYDLAEVEVLSSIIVLDSGNEIPRVTLTVWMSFSFFPYWGVPGERSVISVTVNTVRFHVMRIRNVISLTTFSAGKLSLTGYFVVFISLAFETTKLIRSPINTQPSLLFLWKWEGRGVQS